MFVGFDLERIRRHVRIHLFLSLQYRLKVLLLLLRALYQALSFSFKQLLGGLFSLTGFLDVFPSILNFSDTMKCLLKRTFRLEL